MYTGGKNVNYVPCCWCVCVSKKEMWTERKDEKLVHSRTQFLFFFIYIFNFSCFMDFSYHFFLFVVRPFKLSISTPATFFFCWWMCVTRNKQKFFVHRIQNEGIKIWIFDVTYTQRSGMKEMERNMKKKFSSLFTDFLMKNDVYV